MKGIIFPSLGSEPIIEESEIPKPAPDQLLVKSLYMAINPVDAMIPAYGILVNTWPVGLGADACGIVIEVGNEVQTFKKGDYVCGTTRIAWSKEYSTAREYFLMDAGITMRKPKNISTASAATIWAAFDTAALGLFEGLGIDPEGKVDGEWILILGGAGSVGGAAVQLATACGFRVVATCSEKSYEKVKGYGAVVVIDYRKTLEEQLKNVPDGIVKIFDATSADDPELAKAVFRKAEGGGPKLFATTNDWSKIGDFEGGTTYEIELGLVGRPDSKELDGQIAKYNEMLTAMFESGSIKPLEYEEIGTGGLEDAIKAFKHKGDGRKVIVKIQEE